MSRVPGCGSHVVNEVRQTMQRRKFIIGTGALVAGSAAALGSGAFSSVEAERDVTVEVADDNNAYLGLAAERDDIISDDGDDGQLTIDLGSETTNEGGEGFNDEAITEIEGVFRITNQGTQTVGAGFVEDEDDPVIFRNMTAEKEVIEGVTFEVQDAGEWDDVDNAGAELGPGDSTLVDVTVNTLDYDPEEVEDGSVLIGAYVDDF